VGMWRTLIESSLPPVEQRAADEVYEFGPPATEDQLAAAERTLGFRLPGDLREMLGEYNGFRYSTAPDEDGDALLHFSYLNTVEMSVEVPDYLAEFGCPAKAADFRKVVFFFQSNGYGDMLGVCVADVAGHAAGSVVKVDHEVGELEAFAGSLRELLAPEPG